MTFKKLRPYRVITFNLAVIITITLLHLIKVPDVPDEIVIFNGVDKAFHYIMFLFTSFSISRCLAHHSIKKNNWTLSVISLISYATIMEILQDKMTIYRSFEWADLTADFLGIAAGAWIAHRRILPFFFQHKIWKPS